MDTAPLIAILLLTNVITREEANKLGQELPGQTRPLSAYRLITQLEEILGRPIGKVV